MTAFLAGILVTLAAIGALIAWLARQAEEEDAEAWTIYTASEQ